MPNFYNPYYPQNYYQPQTPTSQNQIPQTQQMQSGGFVVVPNEDVAINYPVALGNCVTFKIEGKPIVIEKSMGFSQLESPKIERYRLVKEQPTIPQNESEDTEAYKLSYDKLRDEIDMLKKQIDVLKKQIDTMNSSIEKPKQKLKKEMTEDDAE